MGGEDAGVVGGAPRTPEVGAAYQKRVSACSRRVEDGLSAVSGRRRRIEGSKRWRVVEIPSS